MGGVFGIPMLRPDWSIKTKRVGLVSHTGGVLSLGTHKGKMLGVREDCWSQELLGMSYQELTFACNYAGCYQGHVLAWGD